MNQEGALHMQEPERLWFEIWRGACLRGGSLERGGMGFKDLRNAKFSCNVWGRERHWIFPSLKHTQRSASPLMKAHSSGSSPSSRKRATRQHGCKRGESSLLPVYLPRQCHLNPHFPWEAHSAVLIRVEGQFSHTRNKNELQNERQRSNNAELCRLIGSRWSNCITGCFLKFRDTRLIYNVL